MLKVYLVDDEVLIIEELKRLIDWNKYGFEVVGSSTNSKTAFVDISKMKPALVISDINMPLMNGLTLFEKVKEVNPLINFCYLSAYDNFEYVQEALKLGAISYLKKPIIIDDLVALLENILKNFDAEFSSKLFDASISRQYYEKDPYIQSLFENNSFIGSSGTYRIVTFSNFGENKVDLLRVFPAGYYPIYNDKKMLIVLSYGCDLSYLTTLSANLDLAIGVSEEFSNFEKVSKHLRFSRIASYQSFISKKNESTLVVDNPKLPVLLGEINEATNVYELQMALSKLEEKILAYDIKVYDLQSIYRISMFNLVKFNIIPFDFKFDEISVVNNYDSLEDFCKDINSYFATNSDEQISVSVIDQVKAEIENNISEHYSLSFFAEKYHYNLSYFSQLFKKEMGCSFAEYVTNVKMDIAKLLMTNSELSLSQIAERVGYKDYYHFSKMFKKVTNMTPTDYYKSNQIKI